MQGIRTEAVSNGETALRRLDADPSIDVMLSDIRMPGMDGLTLAKTAIDRRGEEHALEVVMLTGHATVNDAAASARLRAIDFMVKPLSLTTLKATLLHAHESARKRREKWQRSRALEAVYDETVKQVGDLQSLVTELREALAEPRPADDGGRSAFLAVVNHELRTPLVPIIGLAEMIEAELDSIAPAELRSLVHEIRLGGERLERSMSRITSLADLIAGRSGHTRRSGARTASSKRCSACSPRGWPSADKCCTRQSKPRGRSPPIAPGSSRCLRNCSTMPAASRRLVRRSHCLSAMTGTG